MAVYHVLADGRRVSDITGHVVRFEDAPTFYQVIHKIAQRAKGETSSATSGEKEVHTN